MSELNKGLIQQIYRTTTDLSAWEQVLEIILDMTGATKVFLALRDRQTAEFVMPSGIVFSPLIVGFEERYIESYLREYMAHDPWTEIERKRHPFTPYAMSEELPIDELQTTHFWNWLEPQGISDTIVVGIAMSETQWVGLNIYWDHHQSHVKEAVLHLLNTHLDELKQAWQLGEIIRGLSATIDCNVNLIEKIDAPTFLIHQDAQVIKSNGTAIAYMSEENAVLEIAQKKIKFKQPNIQTTFIKALSSGHDSSTRLSFNNARFRFILTRLGTQADLLGKQMAIYSLSYLAFETPIWTSEGLTDRQRDLARYIALGGRLVDYCHKNNISDAAGKQHSQNIRGKLKLTDIRQLREIHMVFESKYGKNLEWYVDFP